MGKLQGEHSAVVAWRLSCGLITVFPLLRWIKSRLGQCIYMVTYGPAIYTKSTDVCYIFWCLKRFIRRFRKRFNFGRTATATAT